MPIRAATCPKCTTKRHSEHVCPAIAELSRKRVPSATFEMHDKGRELDPNTRSERLAARSRVKAGLKGRRHSRSRVVAGQRDSAILPRFDDDATTPLSRDARDAQDAAENGRRHAIEAVGAGGTSRRLVAQFHCSTERSVAGAPALRASASATDIGCPQTFRLTTNIRHKFDLSTTI